MRFLMLGRSVGRIEKKRPKKKNHKKSQNRKPWYPRMKLKVNIRGFIKVLNGRATEFDTRAKNWQGPEGLPPPTPRGGRGHAPPENFEIV